MHNFDFTPTARPYRRPSAAQIVARWKRAGRPDHFTVEYGETFAQFDRYLLFADCATWRDSGNGCRGVNRHAVVKALQEDFSKLRTRKIAAALSTLVGA
jgi:hypothetical protein